MNHSEGYRMCNPNPSTEYLIIESEKLVQSVTSNAPSTRRQIDAARETIAASKRLMSPKLQKIRSASIAQRRRSGSAA